MRRLNFYSLLLLVALFTQTAVAQSAIEMLCTSRQDYVTDARKAQWLVQLVQEDPEMAKKYGKSKAQDLKNYRESIEKTNDMLKKVVSDNWIITSAKPEFKTKAEIDAMTKKGETDGYAFMTLARYEVVKPALVSNSRVKTVGKPAPVPIKEEAMLGMRLGGNSYRHIGSVTLPQAAPTEAELLTALRLLQNHLLIRETSNSPTAFQDNMAKIGLQMTGKTLLVPAHEVKRGTTAEQIATVYPFPVKLVDKSEIEQAILSKDKNVCFVQTMPAQGGAKPVIMQLVLNAEDGQLLSYSLPAAITRGPVRYEITKDNFKDYQEQIQQK